MGDECYRRSPDLTELLIFQTAYLHLHICSKCGMSLPYGNLKDEIWLNTMMRQSTARSQLLSERPGTSGLHDDCSVPADARLDPQFRHPLLLSDGLPSDQ